MNNKPMLRPIMQRKSEQIFAVNETAIQNPVIGNEFKTKITSLFKYHYGVSISDYFSWHIVSNNGSDRGKLSTRLAKLAGKGNVDQLHPSLTKVIKDAIHYAKSAEAYIDWTFYIRWYAGDFGDSRTCYFPGGSPGTYVRAMHRRGVGAIRRWEHMAGKRGKFKGCARAWMAVDQPEPHCVLIYNRYGNAPHCTSFATWLAKVLSDMEIGNFNLTTVKLTRNGPGHLNGDCAGLWNTDIYGNKPPFSRIVRIPINLSEAGDTL